MELGAILDEKFRTWKPGAQISQYWSKRWSSLECRSLGRAASKCKTCELALPRKILLVDLVTIMQGRRMRPRLRLR
eukprot:12179719-Prorocentrum_lima.AAC.1